jgi:enoyl-CoA hydratase/carnithine racemase
MSGTLQVKREGHALVLTISNPSMRNALGPEMYPALLGGLQTAENDASISSVILTGEGKFFCAGGNLNRLQGNRDQPRAIQEASIDQLHSMIEAVIHCPKPVIAAVEGAAAGAGYSLALACDLMVASRDAQFVMAYVKVGLSPDGGGSWQLLATLPKQLAMEQLLTGAPFSAPRLHAAGLVNLLSEPGAALADAKSLAARFDSLSPVAVAAAKKLAFGVKSRTLKEQMDLEKASFVDCLHGPQAGEAIAAFLEKRPAQFARGRNV